MRLSILALATAVNYEPPALRLLLVAAFAEFAVAQWQRRGQPPGSSAPSVPSDAHAHEAPPTMRMFLLTFSDPSVERAFQNHRFVECFFIFLGFCGVNLVVNVSLAIVRPVLWPGCALTAKALAVLVLVRVGIRRMDDTSAAIDCFQACWTVLGWIGVACCLLADNEVVGISEAVFACIGGMWLVTGVHHRILLPNHFVRLLHSLSAVLSCTRLDHRELPRAFFAPLRRLLVPLPPRACRQ